MFNVFKRPMFRRGGSTQGTGIMSHVERRKNFNAGARGTGASNMAQFLKNQANRYRAAGRIGPNPMFGPPNSNSLIPKGSPYMGGIYAAAPIAAQTGLAYLNRPKTLEEKKVMQRISDENALSGEATMPSTLKEQDARRLEASGVGSEISFADSLFMDTETGTYPKFLGRTKDMKIRKDMEEKEDLVTEGEEELFDSEEYRFGLRLKEQEKAKLDRELSTELKKDSGEKDAKYVASDNRSSFEKEKELLDKMIPGGISKAEKALLIGKAISSPGSIADKIDIAGSEGMKLLKDKKQRDRAIAKLAYTGSTQKDIAKISAGKQGFTEKQSIRMENAINILKNPKASAKAKAKAQETLDTVMTVSKAFSKSLDVESIKAQSEINTELRKIKDRLIALGNADPSSAEFSKKLTEYKALRNIGLTTKSSAIKQNITMYDAIINGIVTVNKKDGGRIGYALGTNPMEAPPEMAAMSTKAVSSEQVPTEEVSKNLSFEELRNRLPKEITDDVVNLIKDSNEALQDFSYIRTQGDVNKFNMKYGVNLVLPAQT
tara:strand:- start:4217 stop:5854 length:1638 start_codon:yes stop_codon:yes gene_type:complete